MAIGDLESNLRVERVQDLLSSGEIGLGGSGIGSGEGRVGTLDLEGVVSGVESVHHGEKLVLAQLDLDDTLWLKNTSTSSLVGVHLHHAVRVDRWIENDPSTTTDYEDKSNVSQARQSAGGRKGGRRRTFSIGDDVDKDGLLVSRETVNDERTTADQIQE